VKYEPFADKDFGIKIRENFHSRFWEMYLTCTLIGNSFDGCENDPYKFLVQKMESCFDLVRGQDAEVYFLIPECRPVYCSGRT
jgi:hypothetical protein